ncbi:MAG: acyl transferase [Bacteroidia bacterium]|nr:acyl transferase [Bacteroidia bacterium]
MITSEDIFRIDSEDQFNAQALRVFKYQFETNSVYRSFCDLLFINPSDISHFKDIPFLPIEFFKTHKVVCGEPEIDMVFESSGTTAQVKSKHFVADKSLYIKSFVSAFELFFGPVESFTILGLLPSYLERQDSSLVYMMNHLIKKSKKPESGFYLGELNSLADLLKQLDKAGRKVLLVGVSFALMDLVELMTFQLKNTIIMETGGMKGRRKEMVREELHNMLKTGFGVNTIYSEYGMTELLSQAYSRGEGIFRTPPWMKILTRDTEDPLTLLSPGISGGINIIDLANINSCAFIATQDLGKMFGDGSFEILGRFDQSDIRGCNLMIL